jgi:hypothetical protein
MHNEQMQMINRHTLCQGEIIYHHGKEATNIAKTTREVMAESRE